MSRRNNDERLGAPHPDAPTPPTQTTGGDLFSFVNPTEFVDLPSGGTLYPSGHPLHNVETVEIRHMTAKEEDILTSETLLRRGLAIDKLVESVLVDKNLHPSTLLVGDKNAILIASRITGFGTIYDATVACPECLEQQAETFDLGAIQNKTVDTTGAEVTPEGTYIFPLPVTGVNIEIKLLTSGDETRITQTVANRKKNNLPETNSTLLLKALVVSANGITDPSQLTRFADVMPLQDAQHIRGMYQQLRPDVDMSLPFNCTKCTYDGEVTMPLTADFFWPKR